jgi:hypothetical protein
MKWREGKEILERRGRKERKFREGRCGKLRKNGKLRRSV